MTTQKYLERKAESTNFMLEDCLDSAIADLENKLNELKRRKASITNKEESWSHRAMSLECSLETLERNGASYDIEQALNACRAMATLEKFMDVVDIEKN